jgi:hypothetical protein
MPRSSARTRCWKSATSTAAARKERHPDEWDPPYEPYDPHVPGDSGTINEKRQTPLARL